MFKLVQQGPAFDVFLIDLFLSQFSGCLVSSCFVAGTVLDTGWGAKPELDALVSSQGAGELCVRQQVNGWVKLPQAKGAEDQEPCAWDRVAPDCRGDGAPALALRRLWWHDWGPAL